MARKTSTTSHSRNKNKKPSSVKKFIIPILAVVAIAGIGFGLWKLLSSSDFSRADLDKYVEQKQNANKKKLLDSGANVYIDMSDGMIYAYEKEEHKKVLQAIINKLAANDNFNFYKLAESKIDALTSSHTALYNQLLNPESYKKLWSAPIERALDTIVKANKPAVLMTDFEEYKDGAIQKAAYAKRYFVDWLSKGYNITFYKWEFTENNNGKATNKCMYIAVFDDNAQRLTSLVDNAISDKTKKFVLAGRDFAYPISTTYEFDGGNYHNNDGVDAVTSVIANGGAEDYCSYSKPIGSGTDAVKLDVLNGACAEYYPIAISWRDALDNIEGVSPKFEHLLSKLHINFGAQHGYSINGIVVRTFNMQETMKSVAAGDSIKDESAPEINNFLTAGMGKHNDKLGNEIYVDFAPKFKGEFEGNFNPTDLIRADIIISDAKADKDRVNEFFSWEGNTSLADAIIETLSSINPEGRVVYTYYLKALSD